MAEDQFGLSTGNQGTGRPFWRTIWLNGGLILGFYTFLVLLFLPQVILYSIELPNAPPWYVFGWRLAVAHYLWAMLTPAVFWLGGRLAVEPGNLFRNLVLHFVFSLLFAAFHTIAYQHVTGFFNGDSFAQVNTSLFRSRAVFLNSVTNGFVFYAGILAFNQAVNYAVKYRDREFRLQQAELAALKTQLHPHFLFNTLNAISALIYVSPPKAVVTISQLGDLLRLTLRNNKAQEVTLKDELDFLRKYLLIQQTLLQERLEIIWAIEPKTLDALVPNMLLQPLVENSIRHGIAPREDGGHIEISSRQVDHNIMIEIKDNGIDAGSAAVQSGIGESGGIGHKGIGLMNSKMRLKRLYGEAQKFESSALPGGGWRARVIIPFREYTPEEASK